MDKVRIDVVECDSDHIHSALGISDMRLIELKDILSEIYRNKQLTVVEMMAVLASEANDPNEYSYLVFYLGAAVQSSSSQ